MNKLRDALASAEQLFARLSGREKIMVSALAATATAGLLLLGALGFSRAIHRRQVSIEEKTKALEEIGTLASTYRERDGRRRQLEERLRVPVKLFTYIDDLSKKQGIEIGDMQDRGATTGADKITESVVEFDLSKLTLDKLTSFLNAIERGPHIVKVTKIRLRTRLDDPNAVDASLTVATYSASG
ncbi:MAG: type II secretion system protein GspM [Myxococcales bacterium]